MLEVLKLSRHELGELYGVEHALEAILSLSYILIMFTPVNKLAFPYYTIYSILGMSLERRNCNEPLEPLPQASSHSTYAYLR